MKGKKIISLILILVLAIQILPVRQVIKYFFIDNQLTEEITHTDKAPTKNVRMLDEDKLLHGLEIPSAPFVILDKDAFFHFSDTLPSLYTAEILTPLPTLLNI
ncbi:MAG: hypothetical protein WDM90_01345 [Ferruginibacter sp.]